MYQRFPGGDQPPGQPSSANLPRSVFWAVRLMYAGAAASLIGIVVDMTTLSTTKSAIVSHNPGLTPAQVNSAEHVAVGLFIASGLIGAALWLWMARSNRAGQSWARIVSTVLFAIDTISVLTSLVGATTASGGIPARIYGIVVWLIGLAAVVYLWQRESSDFFKRPRY